MSFSPMRGCNTKTRRTSIQRTIFSSPPKELQNGFFLLVFEFNANKALHVFSSRLGFFYEAYFSHSSLFFGIYLLVWSFDSRKRNLFLKLLLREKSLLMNSDTDLRSVRVDMDAPPSIITATLNHRVNLEKTDYSSYLRRAAGINAPYIPCAVISMALDLIFTLIGLVIGTSNFSACPVEPRVPIYLVVSSTVNLVVLVVTAMSVYLHLQKKDEKLSGFFCVFSSSVLVIVLQLFNFIWAIVGSVWVFSIYPRVQYTQMNQPNYCHSNVYQYTFISVILQFIIPFALCCCRIAPCKRSTRERPLHG